MQRGRLPANGSGMSDVVHWLFNDGASSRLGGGADVTMPDSMSVVSLQARAAAARRVHTVSGILATHPAALWNRELYARPCAAGPVS